jgi:cytochrome d ubiquinol oxidase subunit II
MDVTMLSRLQFAAATMFHYLFVGSFLPAHNSASTQLTLTIMLVVVLIFVPVVLAYQLWAYRLFHGKITQDDLVY